MSEYSLNIFNSTILLGSLHGVWVSFLLMRSTTFRNKSNIFGALLILGFSVSIFYQMLIDISPAQSLRTLFFLPLNWGLLVAFSFYRFVGSLVNRKLSNMVAGMALLLFIVHFIFQATNFVLAAIHSPLLWRNIGIIVTGLKAFEFISIFFSIFILYISLKLISDHEINLRNNFSSIEKSSLMWLKRLLYILGCLWILWSVPYIVEEVTSSHKQWHHYPLWLGMSVVIYWIGYSIYFRREQFQDLLFEVDMSDLKKKSSSISGSSDEHFQRIVDIVDNKRLYLKHDLSLKALGDEIELSGGYLSQIMNQKGTTFYDFINGKRIEYAGKLIVDPKFSHYSLLAIAMESGFNSKSTFNAAFKKHLGMTPTKYRESLQVPKI